MAKARNQRKLYEKKSIILENQLHDRDFGSEKVQVCLLDKRILDLQEHLKTNKKDNAAIRQIKQLVSRRRSMTLRLQKINKKNS